MEKDYIYEMIAHPSLEGESNSERKSNVYFSEPKNGINENTGILLMIAGFGGNANSNVYKKMRRTFADKYNLVTIQCDYFGSEFMQSPDQLSLNINKEYLLKNFNEAEVKYIYKDGLDFQRFIEIASKYGLNIQAKEILNESLENYNDMGLLQAIDNISAVTNVISIIEDNNLKINKDRKILYGNSHGAYLSYLCNAFAPDMFSLLIDNSSWLFPEYLENNRFVNNIYGNAVITTEFEYIAKNIGYDREILNLELLYEKFENKCKIICYHGDDDNLINHREKMKLSGIINNFDYNLISQSKIDDKIFKSNNQGLGADYLKLFDHVIKNNSGELKGRTLYQEENIYYQTNKYNYLINYEDIMPVVERENIL